MFFTLLLFFFFWGGGGGGGLARYVCVNIFEVIFGR